MEKYGEGRLLHPNNAIDTNTLQWISQVIEWAARRNDFQLIMQPESDPKIRAFQRSCGEYGISLFHRIAQSYPERTSPFPGDGLDSRDPIYISPEEAALLLELETQYKPSVTPGPITELHPNTRRAFKSVAQIAIDRS